MPRLFGWVNLYPEHLVADEDRPVLTIAKTARKERLAVYTREQDAVCLREDGQSTHRVQANLPDGTVFEVIGRMGEPGDSFAYRVGLFADYDVAFAVAGSVNVNGARGSVRLVFDYEPVHRSDEEYAAHRRKARYNDRAYYLHSVVEITNDPATAARRRLAG